MTNEKQNQTPKTKSSISIPGRIAITGVGLLVAGLGITMISGGAEIVASIFKKAPEVAQQVVETASDLVDELDELEALEAAEQAIL